MEHINDRKRPMVGKVSCVDPNYCECSGLMDHGISILKSWENRTRHSQESRCKYLAEKRAGNVVSKLKAGLSLSRRPSLQRDCWRPKCA